SRDWSSDVCSSDLKIERRHRFGLERTRVDAAKERMVFIGAGTCRRDHAVDAHGPAPQIDGGRTDETVERAGGYGEVRLAGGADKGLGSERERDGARAFGLDEHSASFLNQAEGE